MAPIANSYSSPPVAFSTPRHHPGSKNFTTPRLITGWPSLTSAGAAATSATRRDPGAAGGGFDGGFDSGSGATSSFSLPSWSSEACEWCAASSSASTGEAWQGDVPGQLDASSSTSRFSRRIARREGHRRFSARRSWRTIQAPADKLSDLAGVLILQDEFGVHAIAPGVRPQRPP